jgi:hypothetical protein
MDLLRGLLSRFSSPAPDPRRNRFVVPSTTTAVDRKSLTNGVLAALPSVSIPDLLSIIVDYASDNIVWPPATELLYRQLTIVGNKATSHASADVCLRIIASEGPRRWRILTELDPNAPAVQMAIGISTAPAGASISRYDKLTDLFVSSSMAVGDSCNVCTQDGTNLTATEIWRSFGRQTMTAVDVDLTGRTMTVSFEDERSAVRSVCIRLPLVSSEPWRPFVAIGGAASATILPWSDD